MAKLVDILARELKVWEWQTVVVGQMKNGQLRLNHSIEENEFFSTQAFELAEDWVSANVFKAEWQAARDALVAAEDSAHDWRKAPDGATHFDPVDQNHLRQLGPIAQCWSAPTQSWVEKGWQYPNDLSTMPRLIARTSWNGEGLPPVGIECEYLGAHQYDKWSVVRIFASHGVHVFVDYGDGWRAERDASRFRPIRTAEQIAADELAAKVDAMLSLDTYPNGDAAGGLMSRRAFCEALIADGYRKQVAE